MNRDTNTTKSPYFTGLAEVTAGDLEAKNGNTPIDMVCAGHGVSQDKETKRSIVDLLRAPPARSIRRA